MIPENSKDTTTIEVTMATYNKLRSVRDQIAKILRKRTVSFDTMFKLFFVAQPLDVVLQDLILAEMPSVTFKKKVEREPHKETEIDE